MPRNCLGIGPILPFPTHSVKHGPITKEARNKKIFELWLACYTQEEIAGMMAVDQKTVTNVISGETADLPKFLKPQADHLVDFTPPVYNVWKFKERTHGGPGFFTESYACRNIPQRLILPMFPVVEQW